MIPAMKSVAQTMGEMKKSVIESTVILVSGAALYLIKIRSLVAMGSNDGDNGAVTLDQNDMSPQGRRVTGFGGEMGQGGRGQGGRGQSGGNQDLGN